ncbi:MAG: hydantoinase/carbamoylase family amidase [Ginsengibacter sp.]
MKNYSERALLINERINELSTYSDKEHGVARQFGTKAFAECGNKIATWMRDAGLDTRIDHIGNIRGKLKSKYAVSKTFVIGSHFDTKIKAGKYDGVLGIVSGIDLLENLIAKNILLPFDIELIAFSDTEGARFNCPYMGSRVVAGSFKNKFLQLEDREGISLANALKSLNYDVEKIKEESINSENWLGYFEMQMEPASFLYEQNIPVGLGYSIFGEKRIDIKFTGKTGEAGVVPMNMRADALCAAAKFILSVEKYASGEKRKLLATVGKIEVDDSSANLIPASVNCTLDIRSDNPQLLSDAYERINSMCEKICDKRNIYFEWKLIEETDPVICNKKFRKLLSNGIAAKNIQLINLECGSEQDAAVIAKVAPVCVLMVKSYKRNRNSSEEVEISDLETALEISDQFILDLASPEKLLKKKEK